MDSARAAIRLYQGEAHPTTLAYDLSKWADQAIKELVQEVEGA